MKTPTLFAIAVSVLISACAIPSGAVGQAYAPERSMSAWKPEPICQKPRFVAVSEPAVVYGAIEQALRDSGCFTFVPSKSKRDIGVVRYRLDADVYTPTRQAIGAIAGIGAAVPTFGAGLAVIPLVNKLSNGFRVTLEYTDRMNASAKKYRVLRGIGEETVFFVKDLDRAYYKATWKAIENMISTAR